MVGGDFAFGEPSHIDAARIVGKGFEAASDAESEGKETNGYGRCRDDVGCFHCQ